MVTQMVIKGNALSDYLKKYKVSRFDFLSALNKGDVIFDKDEDDGTFDFIEMQDDYLTESDLFKDGARLNYESSKKFINLIGAKDATKLIDWEAMGIEEPNFSKVPDGNGLARLFYAIGQLASQNACQSYAL